MITHALLDTYESVQGEYERLPLSERPDELLWSMVDGLVLDLHMTKHGYASAGYVKHLDRELKRLCADESVVKRLRELMF
ncbi:MAG: hypothetical protein E6Q44_17205 [Flavobacteriales bacterium]|jgi:hypothetical protein|nr:MAG: hypothetical protein E6Q44_17205 [Flavobacteriales bacterium]